MKKSIVKKVIKTVNDDGSAKKDNWGNFSFIVELENGDRGYYNARSEDQTKFVVGKEAEYLIEEKEGKTGKKYNKITTQQSEGQWPKGGKPAPEPRIQMISFAMAYTKDLVVGGKVGIQDLEKYFEILYSAMIKKI
jgi:hypothetical protein